MPLCTQRTCGCSLESNSLQITGDGSAGAPWVIDGSSPTVGTRAQRQADTNTFIGKLWWESDKTQLWAHDGVDWYLIQNPKDQFYWNGSVQPYGLSGGKLAVTGSMGLTTPTTNASGLATIPYVLTFLLTPFVLVNNGDGSIDVVLDLQGLPGTSSFTVKAYTRTGGVAASTTINVNWVAIGLVPV